MELIEKRKIIDRTNYCLDWCKKNNRAWDKDIMIHFFERTIDKINDMPSFDSEKLNRINGCWEWVYDYDVESYGYECSLCGWGHDEADISMNYCPRCGAKMENSKEQTK